MKRCSQCAAEYFDDMLEFCLEDGTKLHTVSQTFKPAPTVTRSKSNKSSNDETFNLPFTADEKTLERTTPTASPTVRQENSVIKEKLAAGYKALEMFPLVIALSHNWWQWLYAANQSSASISAFLISANFLIWLLLLAVGAVFSLLAIKRCQNKNYALISLVIMAVNLILFIVPKR